jgi:hypothetical protein
MIAEELRATMQWDEMVTGIGGETKLHEPPLRTSKVFRGRCEIPSAANAAPPLIIFL